MTENALEKLNRFTRREHTEDEVYLFDVTLCDNDIDRDYECFSDAALEQMQALFIGKTGIFDHDLRSGSQTARIFDTQVVRDPQKKTRDGRPYISLRASAYMVRTDSNQDLIREIEGGIKKEVSVSCSAGRRLCSVCGADRAECACSHIPQRVYGGQLCYTVLDDIRDAYEWSFVAVPAQVQAGVTKHFQNKEEITMETEQKELMQEVETMLRSEVLTLCGDGGTVSKALRLAAEKMDIAELMTMKRALLEEQSAEAVVQIAGDCGGLDAFVQR
ncbi:MAG: hypothetical protein II916_05460 [Oscillospiraceae bacterium]|nr:hypothetical protein [Oscillospiraceae bacterium]